MIMPTDYETDEFSSDKSTDDLFNYDNFLLRDNVDLDCIYNENFLQFTNELDIPLFEQDSILLQDATPDEIFCEATKDTNWKENQTNNVDQSWNNLPENSVFSTIDLNNYEELQPSTENNSIHCQNGNQMEICSDTVSLLSHSPTPSHSSSDSFTFNDNSINFQMPESPPISPPRSSNNNVEEISSKNFDDFVLQSQSNSDDSIVQPLFLNGGVYQMISLNTVNQNCNLKQKNNFNSKNIINVQNILPNGSQIKIPINTQSSTNKLKPTKKLIYPKISSPKAINDVSGVQLITIPMCNNTNIISNNAPLINSSKIDIKAFKKQQRMIKNRESACMSRKRKKDYLVSLEKRCEQLINENKQLKAENNTLKQMLAKFQNTNYKSTFVKISNIPTKNAAILLAMLLMVSINVGSIGNMFQSWNRNDLVSNSGNSLSDYHTRHLMSVGEFPTINISEPSWNDANITQYNSTSGTNATCPMYVNQTESVRLATELRRYIGDSFYNWTLGHNKRNRRKINLTNANKYWETKSKRTNRVLRSKSNKLYSLTNRRNRRYTTDNTRWRNNDVQVYSLGMNFEEYSAFFNSIDMKDDTFYVVSLRADHMLIPAMNHNKTSRPKMSLLMPAITSHGIRTNESFSTSDNHITLMKIDCEVTSTNLIQVNQDVIPQHLRSSFQNTSTQYSPQSNVNLSSSVPNLKSGMENNRPENISITKRQMRKQLYKPYFIKTKDDASDELNFNFKKNTQYS